jgi:acyl-CoA thioester hydrolase
MKHLAVETHTEVRYGETDQMGYAHHATAVLWLELGRVRWLREYGLSYRELETQGVLLPVVELQLRYRAPARFEDQIAIRTWPAKLTSTRVTFESTVERLEPQGGRTLLITGSVELVCLDGARHIRRIPDNLREICEKQEKHC